MRRVLVSGAGGFIGHHLVRRLKAEGFWVRGVDINSPEYEDSSADEFLFADLRHRKNAVDAVAGMDDVYHLAADMGGMGFIGTHDFDLRMHNTLIDFNMAYAASVAHPARFFYASTACVYNETKQTAPDAPALREEDAYPAQPDLSYGWTKLITEQLLTELGHKHAEQIRIARFHNVYGPLGSYDNGREKAPAALCRKVAEAVLTGSDHIDVWGDGQQVRSFMYIDDCIEGVRRLMESDYGQPLNLGRDDAISVDDLARMIMSIAGVGLDIHHDLSKPQGVRGRNSNNDKLKQVLNWSPRIPLTTGLALTYHWIQERVAESLRVSP